MRKEIGIHEACIKHFIESLRSDDEESRKQLDYGYSWKKNIAILYSIRPSMQKPNDLIQTEFAKIRYKRASSSWSLYWVHASGKWELYDPHPIVNDLQALLALVKEDQFKCFFK